MEFPQITRLHLLPVLFTALLLNPFAYYVLHVSRTYFWVVPTTILIWFVFKWDSLSANAQLQRPPRLWELAFGVGMLGAIMAAGLLQDPSTRIFGLFDMMVLFIALVVALFGLRSLRHFWVPALFLGIIGIGYRVETVFVDSLRYDSWLAGTIVAIVRALGGAAESDGPMIILPEHGYGRLLVDYGCTGIKGVLAFAFISFIPIIESAQNIKRRALWIAISAAGFYVASVLRLVAVVFAVMAWGQVAVDYHTTIGFGFFMAWLIIVTYAGTSPPKEETPARPPSHPQTA